MKNDELDMAITLEADKNFLDWMRATAPATIASWQRTWKASVNLPGDDYPAAGLYARIQDLEIALRKVHMYEVSVAQSDPTLGPITRGSLLRIRKLVEGALCTCSSREPEDPHQTFCAMKPAHKRILTK